MLVRNGTIHVDSRNPFLNDKLGTKRTIELLTSMVTATPGPFVLAVTGQWGTGKTTFLDIWGAYLETLNVHVLRFNAWASDYCDEPLIAFVAELKNQTSQIQASDTSKKRQRKVTLAATSALAKRLAPAAIKIITAGAIDISGIESDIEKALLSGGAEALAAFTEDQIKSYESTKRKLEEAREELERYAASLNEGQDKTAPVVCFIDELDRCKPDYAIRLLERIKHVLTVPGYMFVLGIDSEQLANSIKAVYGAEFDALGYLKRFVDLSFKLPIFSTKAFCESHITGLGLDPTVINRQDLANIVVDASELAEYLRTPLRDIQQILSRFNAAVRLRTSEVQMPPEYLLFLCFLRSSRPQSYKRLQTDNATIKRIFDVIVASPRDQVEQELYSLLRALSRGWLLAGILRLAFLDSRKSSSEIDLFSKSGGPNADAKERQWIDNCVMAMTSAFQQRRNVHSEALEIVEFSGNFGV